MKADTSFSEKLRAGWTKEQLMAYYVITEAITLLSVMRAHAHARYQKKNLKRRNMK